VYFSKPARQLRLEEAAMLAGLPEHFVLLEEPQAAAH